MFKKRSIYSKVLILAMLLFGNSGLHACPDRQNTTACAINFGNSVTISATADANWLRCKYWYALGEYVTATIEVSSAGVPFVTLPALQYGTTFTVNLGSAPPPPPYSIKITWKGYDAFNNLIPARTEIETLSVSEDCNLTPPTDEYFGKGCFSKLSEGDPGTNSFSLTVDPYLNLYAMASGWYPVMTVYDGSTIYGPFTGTINGSKIYFNTTIPFDGNKCYFVFVQYYDYATNTLQGPYASIDKVCFCEPDYGCNPNIQVETGDAGNGDMSLTFYSLISTPGSYTNVWTVTDQSNTIVYTGLLPTNLVLPAANYKICHHITTAKGEMCEECVTVCFGTSGQGNNFFAPFTVSTSNNLGGGTFNLTAISGNTPFPANTYEVWTIYDQFNNVVGNYSTPPSISLPNGPYTICRRVYLQNGQVIENCITICFYGTSGIEPPKRQTPVAGTKQTASLSAIQQNTEFQINYKSVTNDEIDYLVYNSMGQIILSKTNVDVHDGMNRFVVNLDVAVDVYYVRVSGKSNTITTRVTSWK